MPKKKIGKRFAPRPTGESQDASPQEAIIPDVVIVPDESNRPAARTVEEELSLRKPLTAAQIAAMPYKERPPRDEWPVGDVKDNPKPYKKRRGAEGRTYGSRIGYIDFVSIFGFLFLWAGCSAVEWFILRSMGLIEVSAIILGIVLGLITAGVIMAGSKSGSFGSFDGGSWY